MRLLRTLLVSFTLVSSIFAQDADPSAPKEKHDYQSDVSRLRKIVINSLYSHRDVFVRELVSNANDALEKLRLTALTNKEVWDGSDLNITIRAYPGEEGKSGRVVITDTGIGMTPEELRTNLGTLAKSGTTEFLQQAESASSDGSNTGNLIGAFGLGFYSSFLVADRVFVASRPTRTADVPEPVQHVFSSSAKDSGFEIYPDPRGNTLHRGTEITLVLSDEAEEFLEVSRLQELVNKHSSYSSAFPIYLYHKFEDEVPEEVEEDILDTPTKDVKSEDAESEADAKETTDDEDEVVVEDAVEVEKKEKKEPKMIKVWKEEWMHLNPLPPLWMRDPKDVSDEDHQLFYTATFKDFSRPLAWHHFKGDTGSGVSFRAIIYVPPKLSDTFWTEGPTASSKDIRLMVKRVFITNDLDEPLPKWASFVKVVVDADDLPLNVSRETLQSTTFLKQIRLIIMKRLIQLFAKIAEEDQEKWAKIQEAYGGIIKLGSVESAANREKLGALARFHTNQRNLTSLDDYLANKKKGQKQIFYIADIGKSPEYLKKSVFVEKLHSRGYEVLLLTEPLEEIMFQNVRLWKKFPFQDVAKAGLKFGDEDPEKEKEELEEMKEKFQPLLTWLKEQAGELVREVIVSNRLVISPCAIVTDIGGYTANVEKLISASNKKRNIHEREKAMQDFAKKQKLLEINPKSPLIEGLLRRVENLPGDDEEPDVEAEAELKEVAAILIDGALVRSGYEVSDSNEFFTRVDRVLRRSLGVSETAPTDTTVEPAPPVDPELHDDEDETPPAIPVTEGEDGEPVVELPESLKDKISIEMEEIDEDDPVNAKLDSMHDEL